MNKKIIIINVMSKEEIMTTLSELQLNKTTVQKGFNTMAFSMVKYIANKYTESSFATYLDTINEVFKEKPAEPLALFLKHVYQNDEYRQKIKAGDDDFFISQKLDFEDSNTSAQIFEFKESWKTFDSATKMLVKKTMKSLVERAEAYIEILSDISKLKKMI